MMDNFGATLRYLRQRHKLSQEAAAKLCGMSQTGISTLELRDKLPRQEVLEKIVNGFDVPLSVFTQLYESVNAVELRIITMLRNGEIDKVIEMIESFRVVIEDEEQQS